MKNNIKIAYLNDTMGPYHYARLSAANKFLDCTFIEFSAHDHANLWEGDTTEIEKKIILFRNAPIIHQKPKEIKKRLIYCLSQLKPEIVLISGWDAICSLYAIKWCLKNKVPTIILSESQHIDFNRSPFKEFVKSQLLKIFDSAFVGGTNQEKYLIKLGFDSKKIFKGCDIVDNNYFTKNAKATIAKSEFYFDSLNLPKKYFFVSCRFIEKKNLKFLIKTFKVFSRKFNDWYLVIAGDGPQKNILIELVNALELNERVIFLGYIAYDQIPKYYALSKCFILPSITEQWGLVVNEALASGVPVLVSDKCGSAPELVSKNNVGYTFDPFDRKDLLDKMIKMTNDDLRFTFSNNTLNVISGYGPSHFSENLKKASKYASFNFNNRQSIISKIILNLLIIFNRIK